jgi:hypothetical protein
MTLPDTPLIRRKEAIGHLGISRYRFECLVDEGMIRAARLQDRKGRPRGYAMYRREDIIRARATLVA